MSTNTSSQSAAVAAAAPARNYGIDLLRLVAMFYIVALHILLQGGAMYATTVGSSTYHVAHYLEVLIYCGANIFALISGFVGVSEKEKPVKFASYLNLWFEVLFYGIAALIFYCCMGHAKELTSADYYGVFMPVLSGSYWYFSAYTGLFVIMPVLNAGIRGASKESLRNVFIAMLIVYATIGILLKWVAIGSGYSMLWLIILYLFGAIMKKCEIGKRIPWFMCLILIAIITYISDIWKMKMEEWLVGPLTVDKGLLSKYTSISIVIISMLNVILFSKMKLPGWMVHLVKFAAPSSFAVYLINCQPLIWDHYFKDAFRAYGSKNPLLFLLCVVGSALLFVTGAVLIDRVRQALFKLLHVSQFTAWFEKVLRSGLTKAGAKL